MAKKKSVSIEWGFLPLFLGIIFFALSLLNSLGIVQIKLMSANPFNNVFFGGFILMVSVLITYFLLELIDP